MTDDQAIEVLTPARRAVRRSTTLGTMSTDQVRYLSGASLTMTWRTSLASSFSHLQLAFEYASCHFSSSPFLFSYYNGTAIRNGRLCRRRQPARLDLPACPRPAGSRVACKIADSVCDVLQVVAYNSVGAHARLPIHCAQAAERANIKGLCKNSRPTT